MADLQETALRLIEKFGESRTATLLVPTTAPADPAKPWDVDPTSTESEIPFPCVVTPIDNRLIDGNSVLAGDETVLAAGLSFPTTQPKQDQKILDENVEKNIIRVNKVKPGKTTFLYKLQVRTPGG